MIDLAEITLRPASEADSEFLLRVYASSRSEEMARVPWSEEQKRTFLQMQYSSQTQHYRAEHPAATHEIICLNSVPAGRLYLDRSGDAFHILDITVIPEFRNSGIGTGLLQRIMAEAQSNGRPLTIYVESFNPSLRFFERLGFEKVGEQGFHWLLRWSPERPASKGH